MNTSFSYEALPLRVVFGSGTIASLPEEAARLGLKRLLVLSTHEQDGEARRMACLLGSRAAGTFSGARMHTPVAVTERALGEVRRLGADGLVAMGGGSTTGLSKAIALRTDLPQIIVPTTYAGSEVTPILGETKDGAKITQRTMKVLPKVVIYDVDLTLSLPLAMSVTSGLNAMAHAAEALYAKDANPIISLMAEESLRAFVSALPAIAGDARDRTARGDALYGAFLAGACLGSVGMALHHKLCHVLGGAFDLPHAETHAVVLPHALAYNAPAAPDAMRRVGRAVGAKDAARGLQDFAKRLGAPRALSELGMRQEDLDRAADLALANAYWNPRPLDRDAIRGLLQRAFQGAPATS